MDSQAHYSLIVGKGRVVRNILLFKSCRTLTERQSPDGHAAQIVVRVAGEVDVATSSILADAVARAMAMAADRADLVVDLARVSFIDASGINVLLNAAHQARAVGGTLVLRSPSRAVRRLLDVLHLDEVLAVE